MKRSEMIKIMSDYIYNEVEYDWDMTMDDYSINELLNRIEKAGMLPPEYIQSDPGHFPGDNFSYVSREWEPEE